METIDGFTVRADDELLWAGCREVRSPGNPRGRLLIEGVVFRLGDRRPANPEAALLDRLGCKGPEAFAEATGDFVACYVTPDTVHAFKSFTSQHQLYFSRQQFSIANRLTSFMVGDPALDEDYFARHTLIVPGLQFHGRSTPLAGIERVRPGELITVQGRRFRQQQLVHRRYRYLLEPAQRREDVAPEVLRLLRESISDRLAAYPESDICIEISGGLDSSFIACLVGEMRSNTKGVMFAQPAMPSHRISEGYSREVADRYGIDLNILAPEDLPPVPQVDPGYSDEPSDFFWFGELFSRAVADIATPGALVFTGFGADQLFLRSTAFLPYLLARGEYRHFLRALGPAAHLVSRSPISLALQSLMSQIPRDLYYKLAGRSAGLRWNPLDVSDVNLDRMLYMPVPWLIRGDRQGQYDAERRRAEQELVGDGIICDDWGYFAAPRAVTFPHFTSKQLIDASPYCDLPLLDFVYSDVSALLVHDFSFRYKELLREAQKGIVPEPLRGRANDLFVFNSFQLKYFKQAREFFRELLRSCPEGWIEKRAAVAALEQLEFGIMNSSTRSLVALMGYLSWRKAFLREADARRRAPTQKPWLRWSDARDLKVSGCTN
jgi:asparagine synthase (glutamine-hydrolysing)